MPYRDDDLDDPEGPQDIDLQYAEDDQDDDETSPCPQCGKVVYWDAEYCPHCGQWIVGGSSTAARRARRWFWPIMVALLIAVILVMWHGLRCHFHDIGFAD